jgi:SAM-dependent methyltransferase
MEAKHTPSQGWEAVADEWTAHVREDHDAPYHFNGPAFLSLLPPPGLLTVDLGCGEGRVARELARIGHRVVGVDASPRLVALSRGADPGGDYRVGDAAALPLEDGAADLVAAFMSLHDIESLDGAVCEAARVLRAGGRFCFAIVHPAATAGRLEGEGSEAVLRISGSYLERFAQTFPLGPTTVLSFHRPLEGYSRALEQAGLVVEALRELPTRRRAPGRIPMFLHVRAVKP